MSKRPTTWKYSDWEEVGNKSENFDSFKVYIVKLQEKDGQIFYKVGRTFTDLSSRFKDNLISYDYIESYVIESEDARYICELEDLLHKKCKDLRYSPLVEFGGKTECFSSIDPIRPLLMEEFLT